MEFLSEHSIWIYAFIIVGKISQSMLGVLWLILVNRGEKLKASIVSIFEVSLWLLTAGTVLIGFQDNLIKVAVYVAATAAGIYLGAVLEERLALGLSSIQVIVAQDNLLHGNAAEDLVQILRSSDFAVTVMEGKGKKGKRDVLMLHLKRKRIPGALSIIKTNLTNAMITVSDVKMIRGGYLKK